MTHLRLMEGLRPFIERCDLYGVDIVQIDLCDGLDNPSILIAAEHWRKAVAAFGFEESRSTDDLGRTRAEALWHDVRVHANWSEGETPTGFVLVGKVA